MRSRAAHLDRSTVLTGLLALTVVSVAAAAIGLLADGANGLVVGLAAALIWLGPPAIVSAAVDLALVGHCVSVGRRLAVRAAIIVMTAFIMGACLPYMSATVPNAGWGVATAGAAVIILLPVRGAIAKLMMGLRSDSDTAV